MSAIVTAPHPVLRSTAKPVTKLDKRTLEIIRDMEKTLLAANDPQGVGLAAPQIGIPLRIFLTRPDLRKKPRVFINPEIIQYSQAQQSPEGKRGVYEGCLSIPNHYAPVTRSLSVTVKYQTIEKSKSNAAGPRLRESRTDFSEGELRLIEKTETFSGFPAHVIQHELDHLNGILFIDHVLSQNSRLYHVKGKEWEEIQF